MGAKAMERVRDDQRKEVIFSGGDPSLKGRTSKRVINIAFVSVVALLVLFMSQRLPKQ